MDFIRSILSINKLVKITIMILVVFSIGGCSKSDEVVGLIATINNVVLEDDYITFDFLLEESKSYTITNLEAVIIDNYGVEVFSDGFEDGFEYGENEGLFINNLSPNEVYYIQIIVDYELEDELYLEIILDEFEFRTSTWDSRITGVVSNLNLSIDEITFEMDIDKLTDVTVLSLSVIVSDPTGEDYIEFFKTDGIIIGEDINFVLLGLDRNVEYIISLSASYELNGFQYSILEEVSSFTTPLWDISPIVEFDIKSLSFEEILYDLDILENLYISITSMNVTLSDSLGNELYLVNEDDGLIVGVNEELVFSNLDSNTEYHIDITIEYIDLSLGVTKTIVFDTHIFNTTNPTVNAFNQSLVESILGSGYTIEEVTHLYPLNNITENLYLIKDENDQLVSFAYNIVFEGAGFSVDSYIKSLVIINLDNTFRYVSIYDDNETPGMADTYYLFDFGSSFNEINIDEIEHDIDSTAGSTITYNAIIGALESIASYHLSGISRLYGIEVIVVGKTTLTTNELQSVFPEGITFNEIVVDNLQSDVINNIYEVFDNTETHIGYIFVLSINGKEDIIEYALGVTINSVSTEFVILYSNETWDYAEIYGRYDGSYGYFYNTTWIDNFMGFDFINDNAEDIDSISGVSITTSSVIDSFKDIIEYYLNNFIN